MIISVPSEQVIVTRGSQRFLAETTHHLFRSILTPNGENPPHESKGEFLAVGIKTKSGHNVYALLANIKPADPQEVYGINAREQGAAQELAEMRGIVYEGRA